MINNEKRKKSKKEIVLISTIGAIVILFAIILCFMSIKNKDAYIMHYSDSSELDYNVYLKQNNFYTTQSLPKNRVYIASLIDYIDTSFNYKFDVTEDLNLGYKYYISAKVLVEDSSGKKIFDKEEILVDKTELQQVQDKKFAISENIKLDYNKYNSLASSFIEEYDISAKASMIVSMYVDVEGTTEKFEKDLNDSAVVSFEIPLTAKTTEITMDYDLTNNSNEVFEYGKTSIANPILFVVGILVAIITIAWLTFEIATYILNKDIKVKYQERLKRIFSDYGSYISKKAMTANTKEIMYTMSLRVEIVNTFDDLINVRDSIEKPILFYESIPGEQAVFYIIDTKVSYIYIMNAKDFDKKKKENSSKATFITAETDNALVTEQSNIEDEEECIEKNNDETVTVEQIELCDDIQVEQESNLEESNNDTEKEEVSKEESINEKITEKKQNQTYKKRNHSTDRSSRYNRMRKNNISLKHKR